MRYIDETLSCDEARAGDKDYTQSEHARKINGNDSDQNESAMCLAIRPIWPWKPADSHFCHNSFLPREHWSLLDAVSSALGACDFLKL